MKKILLILTLCFFSCGSDDSNSRTPQEILSDMEIIDAEINFMLITSCDDNVECRATAYGVKACGGPVEYLIHSTNMDMDRFNLLVETYNELNAAYNEATSAISDCSLEVQPTVDCVSGDCQVVGN
ncbi:hypothetical protein [Ekhidna sp.]